MDAGQGTKRFEWFKVALLYPGDSRHGKEESCGLKYDAAIAIAGSCGLPQGIFKS